MKRKFRFISITTALMSVVLSCLLTSCEDPEQPTITPDPEPETIQAPSIEVDTVEVNRYSATFQLSSDSADGYVYRLREYRYTGSAEDLFFSPESITGDFDQSRSQTITLEGLEKDTDYRLYVASRRTRDTLLYSPVKEILFSTAIPYTDFITLDGCTVNTVQYHIEKPEDAALYRHLIVDELDFIFFENVVGATHTSYLDSFGITERESKDILIDEDFVDLYGYVTNIFSDMGYVIIAGWGNEEKMTEANTEHLVFRTPEAGQLDVDIQIDAQNIQSTTAEVIINLPETGVDRYRVYVISEKDYQSALLEGEEMVRRYILGNWSDTSNEYHESMSFDVNGLVPNTRYHVGLIAFDEAMNEKVMDYVFETSDPVLPLPEFEIEVKDNATPWNKVVLGVKIINSAVSAKCFVATRSAYEEALGREGVTMESIIYANGVPFTESQMYNATKNGIDLMYTNLSPMTEYVFGVMATNEESMSGYEVFFFTTDKAPSVDSEYKDLLPGEYTATAVNQYGEEVSFDITIAKGVNEATTQRYQALNRLVCLGFAPTGVEYNSPEDLLEKGWASNIDEANQNYGPKFYIEFNQDGSITTGVPPTYDNGDSYLDEPMASFNGTTLWFEGLYTDPGDDYIYRTPFAHPIEVVDNGNTLIIKPCKKYNPWSEKEYTYYPGVYRGEDWAYGGDSPFYAQGGDGTITLTRKVDSQAQMWQPTESLVLLPAQTLNIESRNLRRQ